MTFIPAISWEEQITFLWDDNVHFVLGTQSWILIVLTLWKYSAHTHMSLHWAHYSDMSLHWAHYSDYESTSLCLYSFTLFSYIIFIVLGLTRLWIETTIYCTWCEYSNSTFPSQLDSLIVHASLLVTSAASCWHD